MTSASAKSAKGKLALSDAQRAKVESNKLIARARKRDMQDVHSSGVAENPCEPTSASALTSAQVEMIAAKREAAIVRKRAREQQKEANRVKAADTRLRKSELNEAKQRAEFSKFRKLNDPFYTDSEDEGAVAENAPVALQLGAPPTRSGEAPSRGSSGADVGESRNPTEADTSYADPVIMAANETVFLTSLAQLDDQGDSRPGSSSDPSGTAAREPMAENCGAGQVTRDPEEDPGLRCSLPADRRNCQGADDQVVSDLSNNTERGDAKAPPRLTDLMPTNATTGGEEGGNKRTVESDSTAAGEPSTEGPSEKRPKTGNGSDDANSTGSVIRDPLENPGLRPSCPAGRRNSQGTECQVGSKPNTQERTVDTSTERPTEAILPCSLDSGGEAGGSKRSVENAPSASDQQVAEAPNDKRPRMGSGFDVASNTETVIRDPSENPGLRPSRPAGRRNSQGTECQVVSKLNAQERAVDTSTERPTEAILPRNLDSGGEAGSSKRSVENVSSASGKQAAEVPNDKRSRMGRDVDAASNTETVIRDPTENPGLRPSLPAGRRNSQGAERQVVSDFNLQERAVDTSTGRPAGSMLPCNLDSGGSSDDESCEELEWPDDADSELVHQTKRLTQLDSTWEQSFQNFEAEQVPPVRLVDAGVALEVTCPFLHHRTADLQDLLELDRDGIPVTWPHDLDARVAKLILRERAFLDNAARSPDRARAS